MRATASAGRAAAGRNCRRHAGPACSSPADRRPPTPAAALLLLAVVAAAAWGAESRHLLEDAPPLPGNDRASLDGSALPLPSWVPAGGPELYNYYASLFAPNDLARAMGEGSGLPAAQAALEAAAAAAAQLGAVGGAVPPPVEADATSAVRAYSLALDDMQGMVRSKGYALEEHSVVTNDGYKLRTFRIPYGKNSQPSRRGKRPVVLLIHGISLASTCWVLNKADESLAFILADQGWDVWMFNSRGNTFGREHVSMTDADSRFWDFSLDDMALKDLRGTMKYVQDTSGQPKMALVGHSQGNTLAYMALSADPYLAESVTVLLAMAPCAYIKYMTSSVLTTFMAQANTTTLLNRLPPQEFTYMSPSIQSTLLDGTCQMPLSMPGCLVYMEGMFGPSNRITTSQYRRYWQAWPSSTSLFNILQWCQIYNEPNERFFRFGYGREYDLAAIKAPVVIFSGNNDVLAAPADITAQKKRLRQAGTLAGEYVVNDYSHMDWIWDVSAKRGAYKKVLEVLQRAAALL